MTNYKTEQKKQDKEFEEIGDLWKLIKTKEETESGCPVFERINRQLKSHLLARDTALLEAFKKDVDKLKENPKRDIVFCSSYEIALDDVLSLLKDYNPLKL